MAKNNWSYQPKYKIGTVVEAEDMIGIIERIDNECNIRDNNSKVPEYYIHWKSEGAWTRHDCLDFDTKRDCKVNYDTTIKILPRAGQILYGKNKT